MNTDTSLPLALRGGARGVQIRFVRNKNTGIHFGLDQIDKVVS